MGLAQLGREEAQLMRYLRRVDGHELVIDEAYGGDMCGPAQGERNAPLLRCLGDTPGTPDDDAGG